MGFSNSNAALAFTAKACGAKFDHAATLGALTFWPFPSELSSMLKAFGYEQSAKQVFARTGTAGSKFLEFLGAQSVTEFDASDYEGAKAVHDMNKPLPSQWHKKFDLVFDGGTLEHIYNIPQAVENIGAMLRVGGHLALSTSGNNQTGHGFYQFSPEFCYRVFSEQNGWRTKLVMLVEHQKRPPRFWAVTDPEKIRKRIEVQTSSQLLIMILTERIGHPSQFTTPQQSDYSAIWNARTSAFADEPVAKLSLTTRVYKRLRWELIKARKKLFPPRLQPRTLTHPARGLRQPGIRRLSFEDLAAGRFTS
jgi:SAM-dependent methyltransferase